MDKTIEETLIERYRKVEKYDTPFIVGNNHFHPFSTPSDTPLEIGCKMRKKKNEKGCKKGNSCREIRKFILSFYNKIFTHFFLCYRSFDRIKRVQFLVTVNSSLVLFHFPYYFKTK